MMNAAQCRAARALIEWSQGRLAEEARIGLSTVVDFEKGRRAVSAEAVGKMSATLEAAGVAFTNGGEPGVKLRPLRIGDCVRLVRGTTLWADPNLAEVRDHPAEVVALVDDGTSLGRITVRWENEHQEDGIIPGLFERAQKGD